ncbi:aldo/keto reductase [Paenibacillus ginsengarvi]|uniref:Aldo/keto reductase n=1 Tax=Paenibacillus ginsengarvi TaxID=400777 RepID=A0A3B0CBC2_9BACL|nr:aldo/keto reductase [Paenibacillus ginsengarvi]RKN81954.1 aldo/keto reductase [Paenibacillus ginsengarvi]
MLERTMGRLNYKTSVIMFGAAKLGSVSQEEADTSISFALNNGVHHFDTAASYGDAEVRMGPWMPNVRDGIFLATKTEERSKEKAKEQIRRSLERLRVDSLDLIQLHAVGDIENLDLCTRKGGALEALIEAKEEGIVKAIGITGHGHGAPATHLEALRRYPFDTVLLPLNYYLYSIPQYKEDFDKFMEEAGKQNAAVRVIKAIAKGPWGDGQPRNYSTWYEPFDQQDIIDACVHFALSFPGVVALASAGDIHLFPKIVDAANRFGSMKDEDARRILQGITEYASPFAASIS